MKRRALFFSLWLPFLPGPSSVLPPHWLLNFRCPFSRVQPLGESWEFSAPVHWNMWSGCFAAGTTEIKPTSQHLASCQRGPRDAAVLWKDTCESSRPPQPAVRTMRLGGSLEHKASRLSGSPSIMGLVCKCCRAKKKKKKIQHKSYGPETRLQVFGGGVDYPRAGYRGSSLLYPKGHLAVSFISPLNFFFPQFLAFFFFKFPGPRGTQGI